MACSYWSLSSGLSTSRQENYEQQQKRFASNQSNFVQSMLQCYMEHIIKKEASKQSAYKYYDEPNKSLVEAMIQTYLRKIWHHRNVNKPSKLPAFTYRYMVATLVKRYLEKVASNNDNNKNKYSLQNRKMSSYKNSNNKNLVRKLSMRFENVKSNRLNQVEMKYKHDQSCIQERFGNKRYSKGFNSFGSDKNHNNNRKYFAQTTYFIDEENIQNSLFEDNFDFKDDEVDFNSNKSSYLKSLHVEFKHVQASSSKFKQESSLHCSCKNCPSMKLIKMQSTISTINTKVLPTPKKAPIILRETIGFKLVEYYFKLERPIRFQRRNSLTLYVDIRKKTRKEVNTSDSIAVSSPAPLDLPSPDLDEKNELNKQKHDYIATSKLYDALLEDFLTRFQSLFRKNEKCTNYKSIKYANANSMNDNYANDEMYTNDDNCVHNRCSCINYGKKKTYIDKRWSVTTTTEYEEQSVGAGVSFIDNNDDDSLAITCDSISEIYDDDSLENNLVDVKSFSDNYGDSLNVINLAYDDAANLTNSSVIKNVSSENHSDYGFQQGNSLQSAPANEDSLQLPTSRREGDFAQCDIMQRSSILNQKYDELKAGVDWMNSHMDEFVSKIFNTECLETI